MAEDKSILSKTISFLRFPLAFMIVWGHVYFFIKTGDVEEFAVFSFPVYAYFRSVLIECVCCVALPLFFFISGFLFFYKSEWNKATYFAKMRSRLKSLLVPYLFWVTIAIFMPVCIHLFGLSSGCLENGISTYSLTDWLTCYGIDVFGSEMKSPTNGPLWYLRDLIVISLLAPAFFFLIKKLPVVSLVAFGALWLATGEMVTSYSGPFCFFLGALFAVRKIDFVDFSIGKVKIFGLIYLALMIVYTCFMLAGKYEIGAIFQKFGLVFGLFVFIAVAGILVRKGFRFPSVMTKSGFLIYVYHGIIIGKAAEIAVDAVDMNSEIMLIVMHFVVAGLVSGFGVFLYDASKKVFPKLSSWICGR